MMSQNYLMSQKTQRQEVPVGSKSKAKFKENQRAIKYEWKDEMVEKIGNLMARTSSPL